MDIISTLEWAPNLLRRRSECYWLLGLAVGDAVAAGAGVSFQVSIASLPLPSVKPIDDQYPDIGKVGAPLRKLLTP